MRTTLATLLISSALSASASATSTSCAFVQRDIFDWSGAKVLRLCFPKSRDDLPAFVRRQPEARQGSFFVLPDAFVAAYKERIARLNDIIGPALQVRPEPTCASADLLIFGSHGPFPGTSIAATRWSYKTGTHHLINSWSFFAPDIDVPPGGMEHELGHSAYRLKDVRVRGKEGLTGMYHNWNLDPKGLGSCDVFAIQAKPF